MKTVEQLLQDPQLAQGKLWRAKQRSHHSHRRDHSISTGMANLDERLHWRGWPLHSTTELYCQHWGIGELQLLTPLLKQSTESGGRIAWINPPYIPYAPALAEQGIKPEQCLVLRPDAKEQWWAAEQTLASSAFTVVLTWLSQQSSKDAPFRRLQAAATRGHCLHFNFRPPQLRQQSSPARLRLHLTSTRSSLSVDIIKQPGGWGGQHLSIPRPPALLFKQQAPALWPVYQRSQATPQFIATPPHLAPNSDSAHTPIHNTSSQAH